MAVLQNSGMKKVPIQSAKSIRLSRNCGMDYGVIIGI